MPTNYVGNKTNTQAPSAKPEPQGQITVALPADGDPPNASTYIQPYKVLADFINWLMIPIAKIATTAAEWFKAILPFRAANGHTRFRIDHLGLPGGRINVWDEDWSTGVSFNSAGAGARSADGGYGTLYKTNLSTLSTKLVEASAAADLAAAQVKFAEAGAAVAIMAADLHPIETSPWRVRVEKAGAGASEVNFFGADTPTVGGRHRFVQLLAADSIGDLALLWRKAPTFYSQDLHLVLEWEGKLSAANTVKTECAGGLCLEDGTHTGASQASDFAMFVIGPGGGNWVFHRRSNGGATSGVDTGVAASTNWVRFRIELHGLNVAEDTQRSMRAYINGVRVADVQATIPVDTVRAAPSFNVINTVGGSGGAGMFLGPVRFRQNLYNGDFE